ncbi:hypothetical protein LTS08_005473 [Lithohypha guttulata]|uniref:Hypervirulence associated protein TUDOR domain-containing protein n=1 Tax=Lithohypha guttulata TaxID=1690604 RepID=A0AAN7T3C6_9EURO|nr:hypothetical protein LTR51_003349 [Lithohypha guttulata]KAK5087173.1 hypothetical protein LTR05_004344 [Lithohypha guttulata]KAK5099758.1 hypothetical protein LTS08_005473 [Lithohypha guttulata]
MSEEVQSKNGEAIEVGDTVETPYRGGKHEFQVDKVINDEGEARDEGAKGAIKPPVVVGVDQNNKKVSHKPQTVTDVSKG